MAKASITRKYTLNATGILSVDENGCVALENLDTGALIDIADLLKDFQDRIIKISVNYDEDYVTNQVDE